MTADWQSSLDRVAALQALDGPDVVQQCGTSFLSHSTRADETVVLLHGFTNAPVQARELASAFFDNGSNVLVPRVPHHGLVDPYTKEPSELTPAELESFCDTVCDAAAGLGGRMRVIGLSLGGLLAAYLAKHRDEVSEAVLIAPFFQPKAVPGWADAPFDSAMRALPDVYTWWNPKLHEVEVAGTFAYPKFSMKAVAAQIDMRRRLEREPVRRTTKLARVLLIVNDADIAVRADVARAFVAKHLAPLAEKVDVETIEKSYHFTHDLWEPNGDNRDVMDAVRDRLWPVLGLTPPPHGSLRSPTPGGGYFPEKGPWAEMIPESSVSANE